MACGSSDELALHLTVSLHSALRRIDPARSVERRRVVERVREQITGYFTGYASAIGVALSVIIMAVSLIQLYLFGFFRKSD